MKNEEQSTSAERASCPPVPGTHSHFILICLICLSALFSPSSWPGLRKFPSSPVGRSVHAVSMTCWPPSSCSTRNHTHLLLLF